MAGKAPRKQLATKSPRTPMACKRPSDGSGPAAKRAKTALTPIDSEVIFLDQTFKTGQRLGSAESIETLQRMLALVRALEPVQSKIERDNLDVEAWCPPVALEVHAEQEESTMDRGRIWTVTGPLAWLMMLAIVNTDPKAKTSTVLERFGVLYAGQSRMLLHGPLHAIFGCTHKEKPAWMSPTEFIATVAGDASPDVMDSLGIYAVPENVTVLHVQVGAQAYPPSDELVAKCAAAVEQEDDKTVGLLVRLDVLHGDPMYLRDRRAAAFLRSVMKFEQERPFSEVLLQAQMLILTGRFNTGKETGVMLAEAFGMEREPTVVFRFYDSSQSLKHGDAA
jgi:hypothetical protein